MYLQLYIMSLRSALSSARLTCVRPRFCCVSFQHAPNVLNPHGLAPHLLSSRAAVVRLQCPQLFQQITPLFTQNFSTAADNRSPPNSTDDETPKKAGLIQRFKQMYRDYWYVLVPVHLVTSAVWLGSFYYIVRSGVDIIGLMEYVGVSDTITNQLRDSKAGYVALTYACYKVATPLRYAVTIGGTTLSINKLTAMGWIKPVPSTERLREMYQAKKEGFQDAYAETRMEIMQKKEKMKERHTQVMQDLKRYKQEMRDLKKQDVKK